MRRVEIIAKGDVQRVGYRDAVQNIARKLRLSGTVENVEPYDVRIVAEGEEAALKEFVNAVNIQERPIRVEELQVRWADATGEFQYFRILRGDWQEELGERFDVAIRYLQRSIELGEQNLAVGRENLSIGRMMLEKQDQMLEKQDQMLEKQDQMLEKQDAMLEKQDETIEELRGVRSDLREHMDKRFARIENEIAEIKRAIRELGGSCI
ncbi:MAG: acylphosphatase [Methanothrix sp.]|uniref:acylphosphatase n=1 Tax=Methanothrix sp. TaxID=90426 RepID=UPI0019BAD045|nr:acylphosphatase [Methanothrix sp.]MBC7078986.1 acylphosphatase [Methanothrix sp.]NPU87147.1 acylphosphatase [Methanothrix sp.]